MSFGYFIWLYVGAYDPWDIWEDVCVSVRHPCVCQYSHLSISLVVVCLHLWIYGYHFGWSFHHSSSCLYNKHTQYQLTPFTTDIVFRLIDCFSASFLCSLFIISQDTVTVMTTTPTWWVHLQLRPARCGIYQLCHGPSTGEFLFLNVKPPTDLSIYVAGDYDVCFLISGSHVDAFFTYGAQLLGFAAQQPLGAYHGRHMCILVMVCGPHCVCTEWFLPPLLWLGGLMLLSWMSSTYSTHMVGIKFWGFGRVIQFSAFPAWWGDLFQVWFHLMTQSNPNL